MTVDPAVAVDAAHGGYAPEEPVRVELMRAGAGTRPARVLLLHGLASGSYIWAPLSPVVDDEAELWTAELPWRGVGVAGWPDHSPAAAIAEAFAAVPGGPDLVVGHSFAANATLELLAGPCRSPLPDPPAALLLAAPFYRARGSDFDWASMSYYLNNFHHILASGIRVRSAGRMAAEVEIDVALRAREHVGPAGWMRFFATYLDAPRLDLTRLRMPIAVISGSDDFAAFPIDGEVLANRLPDSRFHLFTSCGHFAMAERTACFARIIDDLLTETRHHRVEGEPRT